MQYGERTNTHPTESGWYYVGMEDDQMCGPILRLSGGVWFDEEGEEVARVWNSAAQCYGSPKRADFWIRQ